MLRLVIRRLGGPPRRLALAQNTATLGRSAKADVHLDDLYASRLHAELRREGDSFRVKDLESANGTLVNGQRIQGEVELGPRDRVQIGSTTIELEEKSTTNGGLGGAGEAGDGSGEGARVFTTPSSLPRAVDDSRISTTFAALLQSARAAGGDIAHQGDLDRRRDLFAVLAKVGVALLSTADIDEVLGQILDFIFEGVPAERAYLLLKERDSPNRLVCRAASYRQFTPRPGKPNRADTPPPREVRISQAIIDAVLEGGRPVLTSDAQTDERFRGRESIVLGGVRSVMAVPLAVGEDRIGLVYVDSPVQSSVFSRDDLSLLSTIASVAAIKIDNTRLVDQRLENERIRTQLASAREIQSRLLPADPPQVPGYDLAGLSFPSLEVGGDYFDFVPLAAGRCLVACGDVTGKGIDAALLMSSLHAAIRAQAETGADPATILQRVNRYIEDTVPYNRFVTLFCAILDPATHVLEWANAGHNPPLLVRAGGEVEALDASGPPVGVDALATFGQHHVSFAHGDVLVGYSDGVAEAMSPSGEEFGTDRLVALVRANPGIDAATLSSRVESDLTTFLAGTPAPDDVTVIMVKRVG
jgi:serine phosphatase RsbU (regulator of sigma subunit)